MIMTVSIQLYYVQFHVPCMNAYSIAVIGCFRFANPRAEVKSQHACADEFLNERQHWHEHHPRGD